MEQRIVSCYEQRKFHLKIKDILNEPCIWASPRDTSHYLPPGIISKRTNFVWNLGQGPQLEGLA